MKLRLIPLLLVSMFLFLSSINIPKTYAEQEFSKAELKRMSDFLDTFTLLGLRTFTAKEILDPKNPYKMIYFGVWYHFMFNTGVIELAPKSQEHGPLTLSDAYVAETLKKYFDYTITEFPSAMSSMDSLHFIWKDGKYFFDGADGEATYLTKVEKAKKLADDTIQMEGFVFYAEDKKDIMGTFVALAKPHTFKGKATWSIISMKINYTPEYAQE